MSGVGRVTWHARGGDVVRSACWGTRPGTRWVFEVGWAEVAGVAREKKVLSCARLRYNEKKNEKILDLSEVGPLPMPLSLHHSRPCRHRCVMVVPAAVVAASHSVRSRYGRRHGRRCVEGRLGQWV